MFDLSGKVAIVSGCNTGLGQGMALALAEAGCDIVGLNIVPANETAAAVEQMERRFKDIPTLPIADIAGEGVKSFVDAEKALVESMVKSRPHTKRRRRRNPNIALPNVPARRTKAASKAAAAEA